MFCATLELLKHLDQSLAYLVGCVGGFSGFLWLRVFTDEKTVCDVAY